jgi:hypothetical protein
MYLRTILLLNGKGGKKNSALYLPLFFGLTGGKHSNDLCSLLATIFLSLVANGQPSARRNLFHSPPLMANPAVSIGIGKASAAIPASTRALDQTCPPASCTIPTRTGFRSK